MTIDDIFNRMKQGENLTVACSRYEETIYSKGEEYRSYLEDGINEVSKKVDEKYIIHQITRALHNSNYYDMYLGDENIIDACKRRGD